MEIYSIGFTQKSAAQFFGALKNVGVRRLMDVRLNNRSQLAGFTKNTDLPFFLKELCDASYVHQPLLAPTQEMLDDYKKKKGSWNEYELCFLCCSRDEQSTVGKLAHFWRGVEASTSAGGCRSNYPHAKHYRGSRAIPR